MTNAALEAEINRRALDILAWCKQEDPKLYRASMTILTKLKALTDAPGASIPTEPTTGSKQESRAPMSRDGDTPLFRVLLRHISDAGKNSSTIARHIRWAEMEYDEYRGAKQKPLGKKAKDDDDQSAESDKEAMERVCKYYGGKSPDEVAYIEGNTRLVEWVRKARRVHRLDAETGKPLAGWRGWDKEQRDKEALKLWNQNMRQEEAAAHLNISARSLREHWPGRQPQQAA